MIEPVVRHEGLHRTRKAAAVNTAGAGSTQRFFTQRQGHRHRLVVRIAVLPDVLKTHDRGLSGFVDKGEKRVEIAVS